MDTITYPGHNMLIYLISVSIEVHEPHAKINYVKLNNR